MALKLHLRGRPCQAYIADMKVRVEADTAYFYPDVFVTCDELDRSAAAEYFKSRPTLIAEVLSESTAAYDRGRKFAAYRELPSLSEYALFDPDAMSVEIFRRDATGHWVLFPSGQGEEVEFTSIGLKLPIESIYDGVRFEPAAQST